MTTGTPPMLDGLDTDLRTRVLAKAFWALGHPVRMRIIDILTEVGESTVGELTEMLPVGQPQVSEHLSCLTDCGFTTSRREGRRVFYRASSPWTAGLLSLMRDHAHTHLAGLLACTGCTPTDLPPDVRRSLEGADPTGDGDHLDAG